MNESLKTNLNIHFQTIYGEILDQNEILDLINEVLSLYNNQDYTQTDPYWSQEDVFLISYGDTFFEKEEIFSTIFSVSKFIS